MMDYLIPAYYLERLAGKAPNLETAEPLRETICELMEEARAPGGPLEKVPKERAEVLFRTAEELQAVFQRSTSCVEGRNGQLAFRNHALHQISEKKREVMKTVHNFLIKRLDGTVAAERFFESKPKDFMTEIMKSAAAIPLPRAERPKQTKPSPITLH
jgi:hypothetical protein